MYANMLGVKEKDILIYPEHLVNLELNKDQSDLLLPSVIEGSYYGALLTAYASVPVLKQRKIELYDLMCSELQIARMFAQYAAIMARNSNVAGFSAQPGRIYTKNGGMALNIHAGNRHRLEIREQLNMFFLWFHKVHKHDDGHLYLIDLL